LPFFYYFDPTYILVIIGLVISVWAQISVNSTFKKYSKMNTLSGVSGKEAAEIVLRSGGATNVPVGAISGELTDHYDPRSNSISLSTPVYSARTAAAVGVAAHEAGHALQYAKNYAPIKIRMAILPACNIASGAAFPLFLIGLFISSFSYSSSPVGTAMMYGGIIAFSVAMLFQLVTLPVEFNASRRAMQALTASGRFTDEELDGARRVLRAAAMTYVAALAVSLLQILRLVLIAGNRRD
jgi:Zn-dependent membrane protease YugP